MSKDLNRVQLIGHLGAMPEMRYLDNGTALTTIRIATSRQWKDANGQLQEQTEWTRCVLWSRLAEIANEYTRTGSRVYVEGRLQTRAWDDADTGEKKYMTEVVVDDLILLDTKRETNGHEQNNGNGRQPAPKQSAGRAGLMPRPRVVPPGAQAANTADGDEDLPF